MITVEFKINNHSEIQYLEEASGKYILFGETKLELFPHHQAKPFSSGEIINTFVQHLDDISINLLAAVIYDLMTKRVVDSVKVNDKRISVDKDEIVKALKNDDSK